MFNEFDDLFDDFFGDKDGSNKNDDPFKRMRDLVNNLNNFDDLNDDLTNPHENELGEAHEVTTFEENGYTFQRSVWNLDSGSIVKVEMISSPLDVGFVPKRKLTLEDKLELAVSEERYEDAANLRDEIKVRDNKSKVAKKKNS